MENNNIISNEPAKLSEEEAIQVARIMETLKNKQAEANAPFIKPPVVPAVTENKTETPVIQVRPLTKEQYDAIKGSPPVPIPVDTMAKLKDVALENISNERAAREPFPDITADAFEPVIPDVTVYNLDTKEKETLHIRPMVPADLRTFKLTNSPLYRLIVGELQKEEDALTQFRIDADALYDLVYQFTVDARTAAKLAKKGAEAFHEVSFDLAFKYSAEDLLKITETVIAFIGKANGAKAEFAGSSSPEEGESEETKKKAV